eukprot:gene17235-22761_t
MSNPTSFIIICSLISLGFALYQFIIIASTKIENSPDVEERSSLNRPEALTRKQLSDLKEVYEAISTGADAFLRAEYSICAVFIGVFALVIFALISWGQEPFYGFLTTVSFLVGALTSILSGYIGMRVAVFSNVRTTINAQKDGYKDCFNTAFRAVFAPDDWLVMMDCISGYGLGGSSIAMFGRVGGGIYTKAADVGADLVGKVINGIPEDDPRNPATIADNVGDNVGDIAGMGSDLFGSFAESTCAALVIASQIDDIRNFGWGAVCFPIVVSSAGILICLICSFVATNIYPVLVEERIELALRTQLILTTVLMIPATIWAAVTYLPETFFIAGVSKNIHATRGNAIACIVAGSIGGLVIGITTEYYTSKIYKPVQELVKACETGAATNIIYGLALGYKSVVLPVFVLAFVIFTSFYLCDLYGIALAAVGMLGNLATGLTIDAYGPVCDNAGGIAEMAELKPEVREKTDALDAAGNTTAAVGKGFAIGSAALVSLALYGAFVVRIRKASSNVEQTVQILEPLTFAFLLIGSMLPYWFSAMTMKSVGEAAMEMVKEVQRQFIANPELLVKNSTARPDYDRCVEISTKSALREMVPPAALVLFSPLIAGTFFGVNAVYGLLTGSLLSGVQLAISMANTGGAWDNCKKQIEGTQGKGTDLHKAAVVGDTVGDPLKDTSGPALNILMKLMAIISLVFAEYFYAINEGRGLFGIPVN